MNQPGTSVSMICRKLFAGMTGCSKLPLISAVSTVVQMVSAVGVGLGDAEPDGDGVGLASGSMASVMRFSPPVSQPLLRMAAPAGQFRPSKPGNGGMMSPQSSSGKIPPVWVEWPFRRTMESWLTVASMYGLLRLFVRWQMTTLPAGAVGMLVADATGEGTGAGVMTSAAIHSWYCGKPEVRSCVMVMVLTDCVGASQALAPLVSATLPSMRPAVASHDGMSVPPA